MRRAPVLLLLALPLAGCTSDGVDRDAESLSIDLHFDLADRLCNARGACSGMDANDPARFEALMDDETRVTGLRLFLGWDDGKERSGAYAFTVTCSRSPDGGCTSDRQLARTTGSFPLTLEEHGLDVPRGARIVLDVAPLTPNAANAPHSYGIDGVLVALRDRPEPRWLS